MTGLADIDGFKICFQVCMWLGFSTLIIKYLFCFPLKPMWRNPTSHRRTNLPLSQKSLPLLQYTAWEQLSTRIRTRWPDNLPLMRQGHGLRFIKANYRRKAGSERELTPVITDQSLLVSFFNVLRTSVLVVEPLIPLFWTSGDVSSGFQSQCGFCLIRTWWRRTCYTLP